MSAVICFTSLRKGPSSFCTSRLVVVWSFLMVLNATVPLLKRYFRFFTPVCGSTAATVVVLLVGLASNIVVYTLLWERWTSLCVKQCLLANVCRIFFFVYLTTCVQYTVWTVWTVWVYTKCFMLLLRVLFVWYGVIFCSNPHTHYSFLGVFICFLLTLFCTQQVTTFMFRDTFCYIQV